MATTPRRVDGVDISHHQSGTLDMAGAKKRGLKWLYHKASEGLSYTDPNYAKRRAEAKKAGLRFGAYHFARPDKTSADALKEAKHFLSVAKVLPGDLRPCLDLETHDLSGLAAVRVWAAAFIAEVKRQTGVLPIIYTPYDLGSVAKGCLIWRPRYNSTNTPPVLPWDIWQFSNGVAGVPHTLLGFGHCDLNTMRTGLTVAQMQIPVKPKATLTLDLTTANIRNFPDMTPAQVKADVTKVKRVSSVAMWQEIEEQADFDSILQVLGNTAWGTTAHGSECVISWLRSVGTIVKSETLKIAEKAPGKFSPARHANRLVLKTPVGLVEFIDVHFTNGAYVGEKRADRKPFWKDCWDATNRLVDTAHAAGRIVFVGGDWNRTITDIPKFDATQVWVVGSGIDGVAFIPPNAKTKITIVKRKQTALNSDHDAKTSRLRIDQM